MPLLSAEIACQLRFLSSERWWCEASLSLCGTVHCKLPWQVLKNPPWSLVEKEEEEEGGKGGGRGGWTEQRVSMVGRRAHVWCIKGGWWWVCLKAGEQSKTVQSRWREYTLITSTSILWLSHLYRGGWWAQVILSSPPWTPLSVRQNGSARPHTVALLH